MISYLKHATSSLIITYYVDNRNKIIKNVRLYSHFGQICIFKEKIEKSNLLWN